MMECGQAAGEGGQRKRRIGQCYSLVRTIGIKLHEDSAPFYLLNSGTLTLPGTYLVLSKCLSNE